MLLRYIMLEHTKKHPTNLDEIIRFHHAGVFYELPKKVAEKYRVSSDTVNANKIFSDVNKKYTKPGALLRGLRARESLTQIEMADKIQVTQSDISQMENGTRKIGRVIAKRIQKLFDVDYRSFLE